MTSFEKAMEFVGLHEWGRRADVGYTNDPVDAGGETRWGISKRAHPDVDIANLSLEDALAIYHRDYWEAYRLDDFPSPLCIAMFDAFVQHNPKRVKEWIPEDHTDWKGFNSQRRLFYLRLIEKNPSQIRFKKGWLNRLSDLDKLCTIEEQEAT